MPRSQAPYLTAIRTLTERLPAEAQFPFDLPFVGRLNLKFTTAVTFFVGENGTGKSTLLEAIAAHCRLPVAGGSRSELGANHGHEQESELSRVLRPAFRLKPWDGYFLRAETHAVFASLLDARAADPEFIGDPYGRYGGRSLHERSHGEAFLAVLQNRMGPGMWLLDEPESALSPQRQLALLVLMDELAQSGETQFIVATHSPVLLTFPDARIVSFDDPGLPTIQIEDTSHFQITRGILQDPQLYWRRLRGA